MCSWVSLSGSNSDLHFSQRWEKSASTDSHTNFTWDDISRVGILTACFENTQPMSRTYSFIFNIILPASQNNSHLCLISVVRLEDIGNFSTENIYYQISNTCFHMNRWSTVLQSTTFLCGHMTYWIIVMSKGVYFITHNIERPSLGYYFSLMQWK